MILLYCYYIITILLHFFENDHYKDAKTSRLEALRKISKQCHWDEGYGTVLDLGLGFRGVRGPASPLVLYMWTMRVPDELLIESADGGCSCIQLRVCLLGTKVGAAKPTRVVCS